jgi:uncharacterized protein YndB with AHSA1/START domain
VISPRTKAKLEFQLESKIQASPEMVFAFLRDIHLHPRDPDSLVPVYDKITEGAVTIGTRYHECVRLPLGQRMNIYSTITAFKPDRMLRYRWESKAMQGDLIYSIQPEGTGSHIRQVQTIECKGFLWLMSPLIRVTFQQRIRNRMDNIRELIEGQG